MIEIAVISIASIHTVSTDQNSHWVFNEGRALNRQGGLKAYFLFIYQRFSSAKRNERIKVFYCHVSQLKSTPHGITQTFCLKSLDLLLCSHYLTAISYIIFPCFLLSQENISRAYQLIRLFFCSLVVSEHIKFKIVVCACKYRQFSNMFIKCVPKQVRQLKYADPIYTSYLVLLRNCLNIILKIYQLLSHTVAKWGKLMGKQLYS